MVGFRNQELDTCRTQVSSIVAAHCLLEQKRTNFQGFEVGSRGGFDTICNIFPKVQYGCDKDDGIVYP